MLNTKGLALCNLYQDYLQVSTPEAKESIKGEMKKLINSQKNLFTLSFKEFKAHISTLAEFTTECEEAYLEYFDNLLTKKGIPFVDLKLVGDSVSIKRYIGQKRKELLKTFRLEKSYDNNALLNYVELEARKILYDYLDDMADINPWYKDVSISKGYCSDTMWNNVDVVFTFPAEKLKSKSFLTKVANFLKQMPVSIEQD